MRNQSFYYLWEYFPGRLHLYSTSIPSVPQKMTNENVEKRGRGGEGERVEGRVRGRRGEERESRGES